MVGFVYSIVGMKDRQVLQWSHMLGVLKDYANSGLGRQLKLAQRDRALAQGYELIEWTFDPLQTLNAHLNFTKLGVVAEEYHRNVYGESTSVLHKGTPTDRLVAQWWIRRAARRAAGRPATEPCRPSRRPRRRRAGQRDPAGAAVARQRRPAPGPRRAAAGARDPDGLHRRCSATRRTLALEWRLQSREIFETYFARGYRVVDFFLDRPQQRGRYLLARAADGEPACGRLNNRPAGPVSVRHGVRGSATCATPAGI